MLDVNLIFSRPGFSLSAAFTLHAGGITVLRDDSGSGKTTLADLLSGAIAPQKGRILSDGDIWFDAASGINRAPQKRGIGFVFQTHRLFPNLTVEEKNQLMARAQKAGKAKRRRMLRCNLGSKTFTKELQRIRTEIQNTVNKALYDILKQSPAQVYALEDLSHRFTFEGKYSRNVRNLLSKWVRGAIKDRFLFKAAKAGAQVVFVPAAYSSQHCPQCGYTAGENRRGDRFECKHCRHKAQADQNGALNLLHRVNDPEYRRYMSKEAVRKLERGRYEAWCQARQEEPLKESVNRKRLKKAA